MSTNVVGFISPEDKTYEKHYKVLKVCVEAGLKELPRETAEYFDESYPSLHLADEKLEIKIPIHERSDDMTEIYEVILSEIPKGVHKIRFSNSW